MPVDKRTLAANLVGYMSRFLGCDLSCAPVGIPLIVPSKRRCRREPSYARPFPLVILVIGKRCVVSARPEIADALRPLLGGRKISARLLGPAFGKRLADVCRECLPKRLAPGGWRFSRPLVFTCSRPRRVPAVPGAIVIDPASTPPLPRARGLRPTPVRLGANGQISRCVLYRGKIVAECYTICVRDNNVGSIGIETAPGFRRRGFGKMCLSALTRCLIDNARVPEYTTAYDNLASVKLATSIGYRLFARMLRVQPR